MKTIGELTKTDLFHIADLATGNYFSGPWSSDHKEVEVGGYGKRRRVEWIQNTEGYDEEFYFEISSENNNGWAWDSGSRLKPKPKEPNRLQFQNNWELINTIAPHRVVDYLRENGFNIENDGR